jgi:hypothetical protein
MLSNLSANPMEVFLLGCSGRAHTGMMEAATFVRSNTHAALEQAGRLYPGWPLFITGHSLGGGASFLCPFPALTIVANNVSNIL